MLKISFALLKITKDKLDQTWSTGGILGLVLATYPSKGLLLSYQDISTLTPFSKHSEEIKKS